MALKTDILRPQVTANGLVISNGSGDDVATIGEADSKNAKFSGAFTSNADAIDADFIVKKESSGDAIKYDAGSDLVTIDCNTDFTSVGAVTLPVGATVERPTGTAGKIRFNSETSTFEGHNGVDWGSIGSGGSASSVEYCQDGYFKIGNVDFWNISDGTNIDTTFDNTSKTIGTGSLKISKDAFNESGESIYTDTFAIDAVGSIDVSFFYLTSANYLDSDVSIVLEDMTGTPTEILPADERLFGSSLLKPYRNSFPIPMGVTSARLKIKIVGPNEAAWDLYLGAIEIKPSDTAVTGAFISDWESATVTVTNKRARNSSITRLYLNGT